MSPEERSTFEPERLAAVARLLRHDPATVRALCEASEAFREIYEDFTTCLERLERFRQLGRVDDLQVEQYVELRDQLGREMTFHLEKSGAREPPRGDGS